VVEYAGSCAFFGPFLGLVFQEFAPFEGSVGFAFFCVAVLLLDGGRVERGCMRN